MWSSIKGTEAVENEESNNLYLAYEILNRQMVSISSGLICWILLYQPLKHEPPLVEMCIITYALSKDLDQTVHTYRKILQDHF